MILARRRAYRGYGDIFDTASTAIARGVADGVSAALPDAQRRITEAITGGLTAALPEAERRLTASVQTGIRSGSKSMEDILSAASGLGPQIQSSIAAGIKTGVNQYKTTILAVAVVAGTAVAASLALAVASLYYQKTCCRR